MRGQVGLTAIALTLTLIAPVIGPGVARAQGSQEIVAGICTFTNIGVTFSAPPLGVLPAATTIDFSGSGGCTTNEGPGSAMLNGTVVGFPGINCIIGVATGAGSISVAPFISPAIQVNVTVANVGGTWDLVATALPRFVGAGAFAQTPLAAQGCVGGISTATWTGALVFEDPPVSL